MAIIYNVTKNKDNYNLIVSQDTTYKLKYISDSFDEVIISFTNVLANSTTKLLTPKDGTYLLELKAENESKEEYVINVIHNLQKSIAIDTLNLLCNKNCKSNLKSPCITKQDTKILKTKNVFNKILTYQSFYIPKYTDDFLTTFSVYLKDSLSLSKCGFQSLINNISLQECINGSSVYDEKLFKTHLFIYWAGFYFIEESIIDSSNTEELEFLKDKFFYNDIINCVCNLCFNITDLKVIFSKKGLPINIDIYFFQLVGTLGDVDLNLITDEYLENTATKYSESVLLDGSNFTLNDIGKYGFAIKTTNENLYTVFDALNTNVTDIIFNKIYDSQREILFFISKNFATPSNIFFKFKK